MIVTVAHFLAPPLFVASVAFYGSVFWHWRNDVKQHDVRRKNSSCPVVDARGFGSWLD